MPKLKDEGVDLAMLATGCIRRGSMLFRNETAKRQIAFGRRRR